MAASVTISRPPTPLEIAQATANAIPWEISTRSVLGIIGVLIGAHLVTLTGRMLTLGLADLKGHLGISYDDGAWLDSAYNASIMFIGPFSVYIGGLLGPRRVLLYASAIFAATCAYLPLIHSYSLLVAALIVAGLTSGTFYPLTMTFALRIKPSAIHAYYDGVLCHGYRWGGERGAISLWLVPRPSFLALDVLEFGCHRTGDVCPYLCWDTASARPKERRPCAAQLRRVPVPERGTGPDVYCPPARPEARLVALRTLQRAVLVRRILPAVRFDTTNAQP